VECGEVQRGFLGSVKRLRVLKGCARSFHLAKRYVGLIVFFGFVVAF